MGQKSNEYVHSKEQEKKKENKKTEKAISSI